MVHLTTAGLEVQMLVTVVILLVGEVVVVDMHMVQGQVVLEVVEDPVLVVVVVDLLMVEGQLVVLEPEVVVEMLMYQ
jgi:cytochrome c oxidase subunit IV